MHLPCPLLLLALAPMGALRFGPLSRDPFTDVGRTIPEFRSVGLTESKEFHAFSVGKKDVLKIDGEAARFLFQYAPKHVDMFPCNPAAHEQHHEIVIANESVDPAAHCRLRFTASTLLVPSESGDYLERPNRVQNSCQCHAYENKRRALALGREFR
jgi:hypothetical protein